MTMELSEREYMVRGLGYLKSIGDIENVVVGADEGWHADSRRGDRPCGHRARQSDVASPTSMDAATPSAASS